VLRLSERAPGLLLGEGVHLPDGVLLGGNVVIHDGTVIGDHAVIQDGAVLGKPPVLGAHSTASREHVGPLELGEGATVGAGTVIAAGARIGARALVGDRAFVRERTVVGEASVVGAATNLDNDVTIRARVKIQTGCYITAFTTIEDDVFVAPCVTTTNDNAMGRHGPDVPLRGALLRRACRVGAGSILLPGIEVGEEAFVAAGALVTRDVASRTLVMGVPAKPVREITDDELIERWR
jgi:UDP-2-acetamido-3-amino-2,3-dideoxy-glucuronate N-acetyltransferase